jgi:hypothetical protein
MKYLSEYMRAPMFKFLAHDILISFYEKFTYVQILKE